MKSKLSRICEAEIKRGDLVIFLLGAANRDPAVYSGADTFDILRQAGRPMAFGSATHRCPGASLAIQMAALAVRELLARADHLELIGELSWSATSLRVRGLTSLDVAVKGPRSRAN